MKPWTNPWTPIRERIRRDTEDAKAFLVILVSLLAVAAALLIAGTCWSNHLRDERYRQRTENGAWRAYWETAPLDTEDAANERAVPVEDGESK